MMRALGRVRSVTARRQLRWIVWGTAFGAVPFVLRLRAAVCARVRAAAAEFELHRGAARARAARLRVRDRPLSPDGRRSHHQARPRLCGGVAAIVAIYAILLRPARRRSLATQDDAQPAHRASRHARRRAAVAPGQERDPDRARPRLLPRSLRLPPRAGRLRARPEQRPGSLPPERTAGAPRHGNAAGRSHGAAARADHQRPRRRVRDHRARRASPASRRRCRARSEVGARLVVGPHAHARRSAGAAPRSTGARSSSGATPGSTTSCRASPRKARSR